VKLALWTTLEPGSAIAAHSADLAAALRRLGVEVDEVPVPFGDRDPARAEETLARLNAADVVHVQHDYPFFGGIAPRGSSLPHYLARLARLARLERPHVVTVHSPLTTAELLRLPGEERPRQRLAKRLLAASPGYRRSLEREPFARAAAVFVHTEDARQAMLRRGLQHGRVHRVPPGIPAPPDEAAGEAAALRERLGLHGGRLATVLAGPAAEGLETALEALRSLPPAARLLVAGSFDAETVRAGIRARGLEGRAAVTSCAGARELAAALAAADAALVPGGAPAGSYLGMIALGAGKPLLAPDTPCFRELFREAPCVELFEAGDERALAERLGFLLASAGARERLAAAAGELAARRTWAAAAAATLALYEGALAGR
jgi:glycosyltransferase involved in cell wall biosynthesis